MYPKLINLHDNPYSVLKTMKNEKDQNVETKETSRIGEREREDEDEEEKRIDTFFKLIKSYQEARKRRREELAENSGDVRKKTNVGEASGAVVPAFQPEDFSQYGCIRSQGRGCKGERRGGRRKRRLMSIPRASLRTRGLLFRLSPGPPIPDRPHLFRPISAVGSPSSRSNPPQTISKKN